MVSTARGSHADKGVPDVPSFMKLVSTIIGSFALVGGLYALLVVRGDPQLIVFSVAFLGGTILLGIAAILHKLGS